MVRILLFQFGRQRDNKEAKVTRKTFYFVFFCNLLLTPPTNVFENIFLDPRFLFLKQGFVWLSIIYCLQCLPSMENKQRLLPLLITRQHSHPRHICADRFSKHFLFCHPRLWYLLSKKEQTVTLTGVVVVAQLVERSLPFPEVRGSNTAVTNFIKNLYLLISVGKANKYA